jgi:hypothetical protein
MVVVEDRLEGGRTSKLVADEIGRLYERTG